MTKITSPVLGLNPSSAAVAASASVEATSTAAQPSPVPSGRTSDKLYLTQPAAAALISSSVMRALDDIAGGGRRDSIIIRATTGAQKTTSVAAALAAHPAVRTGRLHAVIVVRDHIQSADYRDKLIAGGLPLSSVVVYKGRTAADASKPPALQDPTACYQSDAVRAVGAKNHIPAATVCQRCPIGLGMGVQRLRQQIADGTAADKPGYKSPEERLERLDERYADALTGSGVDPAHVQRVVDAGGCFLHRALPAYRAAPVLIVPQDAYNSSLSEAHDILGEQIPDIVIADENLDIAKERYVINGAALDAWMAEIKPYEQGAGPHYGAALTAIQLIERLKAERGQEKKTIEKFLEFFATIKRELARDQKIAWWEMAHWAQDGSGRIVAPLRAIVDLEQALRGLAKGESTGAAVVFADDGIHVATVTPLGQRLIEGNTLILDATITDSTIAALRAAAAPPRDPEQIELEGLELSPAKSGGTVLERARTSIKLIDVVVPQHVSLLHLDGRSYGRGLKTAKGYAGRLQRHQQHLLALILATQAAGSLEQWAVLTQKLYVTDSLKSALRAHGVSQSWIEERLGWWGRDDRAHNRWAGLHILVQSLPQRSHGALRQAWSTLRALNPALPVEPPADYRHETVCADLVQAVGRVRGVYADPADPRRVMVAARIAGELAVLLEGHGLRIEETRENPLVTEKLSHYDLARPIAAVLRMMAQEGRSATVLGIAAAVRAAGYRASTETVLEFLAHLIPAGDRGAKKRGYRHLPQVYLARLARWTREARQALEQAAEAAAEAIGEQPLRGLAQKLLSAAGSWLGFDPGLSTVLPPVPLPAS